MIWNMNNSGKNLGNVILSPRKYQGGGQFDPPLDFTNFLRNPMAFFVKMCICKKSNPRDFNLGSFDGRINVGGQPYPKL